MAAAPWIVSDELWELVEPLLPRRERSRPGGRRRHPDRLTLSGSCSCCTPGSRGGTCRGSSGSGRASPTGGV